MARFIRRFLFFLIPVLVIIFALEGYLRHRTAYNEVLAKQALVQRFPNTALLFLGNSHGRNAFIPDHFEVPALNLCLGGSTPMYNARFLEGLIDDLPDLRHIIYNISYQTLFYDLDALPDEKKKYEFYHYAGIDAGIDQWSLDHASILATVGFKKALDNLRKDVTTKSVHWLQTKGHNPTQKTIRADRLDRQSSQRIKAHHSIMDTSVRQYNIEQLAAVEKIASDRNIQITYVYLPVLSEYGQRYDALYYDFPKQMTAFAAAKNRRFLNLMDSLALGADHFADPDHVNHLGALEISTFLVERIRHD